jgi:hypothetical protein
MRWILFQGLQMQLGSQQKDWIGFPYAREALSGDFWNREYLPVAKKASMEEVHDLRGTIVDA